MHALAWAQQRVIGDEVAAAQFGQARLHHRVAALQNFDAGMLHKLRRAPAQRERAFGQGAQRVQCRQRPRQTGQRGHKGLQLIEQLFKQKLLSRQRALLCAQGFVFKGFELGCNKALGVFEGLAAPVVVGHFAALALADFDIKTMHFVELHAQIRNAGACAFAHFQVQQKRIAIGLDGAQFVQVCVIAVGDHAAVAHHGSRLGRYRCLQ